MEKRLLLVTDALAKRKGLDRSKLIAQAIREMLEREAAGAKTPAKPAGPPDSHQDEIARMSRRAGKAAHLAGAPA